MKKLTLLALAATTALLAASCASVSTLQKDIKYMPIRFKPLGRADITLVGNLQAEVTLSGKINGQSKTLAAAHTANMKDGMLSKFEATETLYFVPGPGEAMTGSLYESDLFNSVIATRNMVLSHLKNKGKGAYKVQKDWGMSFAYFALIEKYPDVDYFINVRFDRKTVVKGKAYTETITCYCDGVKLKTDN